MADAVTEVLEDANAAEALDTAVGARQRIPIGVVGLNFGRHIVNTQLSTGAGTPFFKLAALCDMDVKRAAELAAPLGIKAYGSLDSLLSDPSIPAIALYTGPSGRAELLRKIIRAGKDVMTTKPFEEDPEAARAVLAEARRLGRTIHLNSPAPVLPPDLAQIKQWQGDHDLGQPVACRVGRVGSSPGKSRRLVVRRSVEMPRRADPASGHLCDQRPRRAFRRGGPRPGAFHTAVHGAAHDGQRATRHRLQVRRDRECFRQLLRGRRATITATASC